MNAPDKTYVRLCLPSSDEEGTTFITIFLINKRKWLLFNATSHGNIA